MYIRRHLTYTTNGQDELDCCYSVNFISNHPFINPSIIMYDFFFTLSSCRCQMGLFLLDLMTGGKNPLISYQSAAQFLLDSCCVFIVRSGVVFIPCCQLHLCANVTQNARNCASLIKPSILNLSAERSYMVYSFPYILSLSTFFQSNELFY